jgi:acetyl-CoA C-acetyltransferase
VISKPDEIDDVIMSCSSQFKKQGSCVGRMAALDAGFSTKASGLTLDRFCGGGITAVNLAAANIMSGMEDLIVAGGVEMMSYTRSEAPPFPLDAGNEDLRRLYPQLNVGIAADIIATEENFSRAELDAFSLESQRRAGVALQEGAFNNSLVAVHNPDGTLALDQEEYPRPQTTAESLAGLQPAFEGLMDMPFFDSGRTYREMVAERWPGSGRRSSSSRWQFVRRGRWCWCLGDGITPIRTEKRSETACPYCCHGEYGALTGVHFKRAC